MKTNKNSVRRNLIISATALMLSIAMLIGTTFAWFTDSVTSGRNHIQAGNLDVELKYKNKTTTEFADVTTKTQLFDDSALWEPGHVEYVVLNVHNAGTLALKYNLNVTVDKETEGTSVETNAPFKLSSFLKYAAVAGDISDQGRADMVKAATAANPVALSGGYAVKNKSLLADSKDDVVTLVVWMPEETGNAANYTGNEIPTIELGLTLVATQYTEESDSFDNTYDKDAKYPAVGSVTAPVENGKVKSDIEIETTEKLESDPTSPVARALIPAGAKTTAAGGDTSIQFVLRVEEAPTATIPNVDSFMSNLHTLEVTVDGLADDNTVPIIVNLYMGKQLEDFYLYQNGVEMYWEDDDSDVNYNQAYHYDENTGYVTFATTTFSPFTAEYKKDSWLDHTASNYSVPVDTESKTVTISNAEELALFAKEIEEKQNYNNYTILLNSDIDLSNYLWTPIDAADNLSGAIINGQEHSIYNMTARGPILDDGYPYGCAFIGNATSPITIKNLTFDNANVSCASTVWYPYVGKVCGVVLGYTYGTTLFENVSVTNSEIWGFGKIGTILGMGANPGVKVTFKNCTSKNNTINTACESGGLAGLIQRGKGVDNCNVENCIIENITVNYDPNATYEEFRDATATLKSDDTPSGSDNTKPISGKYFDDGEYYWCAYGNYYVSYGHSSYDAPVFAADGTQYELPLANSEYAVNQN